MRRISLRPASACLAVPPYVRGRTALASLLGRAALASFAAMPILAAAPALAEDIVVAPVTVEATRLPVTQAEAGVAISVLTAQEIEAAGHRNVADALETLAGVTIVRNGPAGGVTGVFIRGLNGDRVLVLIDGVPVNDASAPGGAFDFATLDTAGIERIEVLRGAQSTLWGSGAEGGVVSIITKRGRGAPTATVFAEYGSYETLRTGGTVSGATESADFAISATKFSSQGFSARKGDPDLDGSDGLTINAKGGIALPGDGRLGLTLRRAQSHSDFDFGDQASDAEERSAALSLTLPVWGDVADIAAQVGYAEITRAYTGGFGPYDYTGERRFARLQLNVDANDWNTLSFGAEQERITAYGTYMSQDSDNMTSLFALWETRPVSGLTVSAGLRHDEHSQYGGNRSGRVAAAYAVTDRVTLRGGYGTAFKAPTLAQISFGFPDPKAEKSEGWELGADYASRDGRFSAGVTVFHQDLTDQIEYDLTNFNYTNLDATTYDGVELTARSRLTDSLTLSGAYTYLDARDETAATRLIRRPRHAANASLGWSDGGPLRAQVALTYNDGYPDAAGPVANWVRVDVSAGYAVTETVELYGKVENLLDTDYEYISGYNTAGRSGYLGVRAKF
jgi:vitamin B12 transporter